ncbi:MAG: hypothetical protein KDA53_02495 [Hyphomonas sp.]|nr:hypothetical protein [Hyphomonas sp.]
MIPFRLCLAATALFTLVGGLGAARAETLELDGARWSVEAQEGSDARVEEFLGRKAIYLSRNQAVLDAADLGDMVIEYEYAASHPSGFIGVNFRADLDSGNLEQFYTRPHQSGEPDATQYMVMVNGVATWQLHAGPDEAVATDLPAQEWIRVRIVAIGDKADIYVGDMETPLIHVPHLRRGEASGQFALYASDRPWMAGTGAYFSNIAVRAATADDRIIGVSKVTDPLPEGLLTQFAVSKPFAESDLENIYDLAGLAAANGPWTILPVEDDGIANLARTTPIADRKNTVLVRFRVSADTATHRMMQFGYSDRIRLFVDGALVYAGNAQWRSRDHRFLGTVNLEDSIALNLKAGETEIVAAVSESFGGWGFKAQVENQDGLRISVD